MGMESLLNPVETIRKPQPKNARTRCLEARPVVSEKTGVTSGKKLATEIEHIITASPSLVLPAIILLALETVQLPPSAGTNILFSQGFFIGLSKALLGLR